jgi:hypothetical protein
MTKKSPRKRNKATSAASTNSTTLGNSDISLQEDPASATITRITRWATPRCRRSQIVPFYPLNFRGVLPRSPKAIAG